MGMGMMMRDEMRARRRKFVSFGLVSIGRYRFVVNRVEFKVSGEAINIDNITHKDQLQHPRI